MSDPAFPDDYYMDVETFVEKYEGQEFPAYYEDKNHFECDFCSTGVFYASEPRVGQYLTDRIPHNATPEAREVNNYGKITPMATYCEDCATKLLYFPCEGYTEVRLFMDLDEDMVHKNVEVTDISPADDGIPWDPAEVSSKITGIDFDRHARSQPDVMMAPENIVTFFLSVSTEIDIRELVNHDGTINGKALGRARREYKEFRDKMAKHRNDRSRHRKAFRDHVRGDDT